MINFYKRMISKIKLLKYRGSRASSKVKPLKYEEASLFVNLKDFRKIRAIPVISQGLILGICCADPNKLKSLIKQYPDMDVFLAPWSLIKEALDKTEMEFLNFHKQTKKNLEKKLESAVKTTLELIVSEAMSLGADSVNISLELSSPKYFFTTPDNKKAEGMINSSVRNALIDFLKARAEYKVKNKNLVIKLNANCFTLDWSKESNVLPFSFLDAQVEESKNVVENFILIVDDNQTFSSILDKFLTQKGYFVLKASNGHEALLSLDRSEGLPELIVCDLHMPGVNGREFVYNIKQESLYESIPILMLTSDDHIETELSLLSLGVDTFVSKSLDPLKLVEKIEETMQFKNKNEAA